MAFEESMIKRESLGSPSENNSTLSKLISPNPWSLEGYGRTGCAPVQKPSDSQFVFAYTMMLASTVILDLVETKPFAFSPLLMRTAFNKAEAFHRVIWILKDSIRTSRLQISCQSEMFTLDPDGNHPSVKYCLASVAAPAAIATAILHRCFIRQREHQG